MGELLGPEPGREGMTLVAFDFDGTLSDSEMTVLLGARRGVADEMAEITERSMNDEIEYAESLRQRIELIEGLGEAHVENAFEDVELREGASELIRDLREAGNEVVILTGGFERGVERALADVDIEVDGVVANRLPTADGRLTGEVEGQLVDGTKDDALAAVAEERGIPLDETVAVGDGANDLPMLEVAGLGVGFDPKPAVEPGCDVIVSSFAGLRGVFERRGFL